MLLWPLCVAGHAEAAGILNVGNVPAVGTRHFKSINISIITTTIIITITITTIITITITVITLVTTIITTIIITITTTMAPLFLESHVQGKLRAKMLDRLGLHPKEMLRLTTRLRTVLLTVRGEGRRDHVIRSVTSLWHFQGHS